MITKFGKFCRKLRIDKGELLYDMATKLGVSPSFLSKVENGKKKPPIEWEEIIINEYGLSGTELEDFREAFFDAKNSESIDISRMAASDKELMLSFARQFDSIDKMAIKRLLENKRED
jgi:transcriptional regulator with XRE-family HTH domain